MKYNNGEYDMASFNYLSYDQLKTNVKSLVAAVKSKHELTKSDSSETRVKREAQVALNESSILALDQMLAECTNIDETCLKFASMTLTGTLLHIKKQIKKEYDYENSYSAVAFILSALSSPESSALYAGINDAIGITKTNTPDIADMELLEACTQGHLDYLANPDQKTPSDVIKPTLLLKSSTTESQPIKFDTKSLIHMKMNVHPQLQPNLFLMPRKSKASLEIKESKELAKSKNCPYRR